jgi:hypothetical protein
MGVFGFMCGRTSSRVRVRAVDCGASTARIS